MRICSVISDCNRGEVNNAQFVDVSFRTSAIGLGKRIVSILLPVKLVITIIKSNCRIGVWCYLILILIFRGEALMSNKVHLTISLSFVLIARNTIDIVELTFIPDITSGNDPTCTRAACHCNVRILTAEDKRARTARNSDIP